MPRLVTDTTLSMATVRIAGERFSGYNKPKRDVQGGKKFVVAAKGRGQGSLSAFWRC